MRTPKQLLHDFVYAMEDDEEEIRRRMKYVIHVFCLSIGTVSALVMLAFGVNPFVSISIGSLVSASQETTDLRAKVLYLGLV